MIESLEKDYRTRLTSCRYFLRKHVDMKKYIFVVIVAVCSLYGCGNYNYLVEDEALLLAYQTDTTPVGLINLSKAYGEAVKNNDKDGIKQPGLYSDYATSLAMLGMREESNKWFNREMITYPSSARYINCIKLQLIPEFAMDTTSNAEIVDLSNFDELLLTYSQADFQADDNKTTLSAEDKKMLKRQKEKEKRIREKEKKKLAKQKAKEKKERAKIKERERKEAQKQKELEKKLKKQAAEESKKEAAANKKNKTDNQ